MTLKEFMEKNNLTASKIVRATGVSSVTVKRVVENNVTRSKKLANWCEDHGIMLGEHLPKRKYEKSPVAKVEIVNKYVVGERLPYCLDSIIAHIYKQKRGQVAILLSNSENFEKRTNWLGIDVKTIEENFERRVYGFEVA